MSVDIAWMRSKVAQSKMPGISDEHLVEYWRAAAGDRALALDAVLEVAQGRSYRPLRELIERRRAEEAT